MPSDELLDRCEVFVDLGKQRSGMTRLVEVLAK